MSSNLQCVTCGVYVNPGQKYCGGCGYLIQWGPPPATLYAGQALPAGQSGIKSITYYDETGAATQTQGSKTVTTRTVKTEQSGELVPYTLCDNGKCTIL
eukprot:m.18971 g.18971  ORF g.18971 m.18971 type:complete len:99 (-) comp5828_c0_seq2:181-477(-)